MADHTRSIRSSIQSRFVQMPWGGFDHQPPSLRYKLCPCYRFWIENSVTKVLQEIIKMFTYQSSLDKRAPNVRIRIRISGLGSSWQEQLVDANSLCFTRASLSLKLLHLKSSRVSNQDLECAKFPSVNHWHWCSKFITVWGFFASSIRRSQTCDWRWPWLV